MTVPTYSTKEQVEMIARIGGMAKRVRERLEAARRLFRVGEFALCEEMKEAMTALSHELYANTTAYEDIVDEIAVRVAKEQRAKAADEGE